MLFPVTLVFLFLIRLRFPAHKSLFQITRERYGPHTVGLLRKLEKNSRLLDKARLDEDFLKRCLDQQVIPKFLRFKLYRQNLRNTQIYKEFQRQLLEKEILNKQVHIRKLKEVVCQLENRLKNIVCRLDFIHFKHFIDNSVCKLHNNVETVHRRKFTSLGGSYDPTFIDPSKCIFNLSNYVLSKRETFLLSLGLDFCMPVFRFPRKRIIISFELLLNRLNSLPRLQSVTFNDVINKVKEIVRTVPKFIHKVHHIISKEDVEILRKLGKNRNIKISRPDKGNGVVILNTVDYIQKMNTILDDNSKFRKCKPHEDIYKYNLNIEDKINYQLRKLKRLNVITEGEYKELYVNGSSPSILYGLPKIHKANTPLRPILSAFKTPSYKLAQFLITGLSLFVNNIFTLKNSYDFKRILEERKFPKSAFLTSFDVTSLFTNVPVKETIDIAVQLMYNNGNSFRNMAQNDFRKLLELCTHDNHFLFNNEHYSQFEGFAMGNPLSATMANLFLSFHEQQWLDECPLSFKPIVYKRYVDDCFVIFKRKSHANKFLNYLNKQHRNINFTIELEEQNKINFLDCTMEKVEDGNLISLIFRVFRKLTFTNLGMNFHSQTLVIFKINNIRTLLHRAYEISSNWKILDKELEFLRSYFVLNGYPKELFFKITKSFLQKKIIHKAVKQTAEKMPFYHNIPFVNNYTCIYIKKNLLKFLSEVYPQININFVFGNNSKIQNLTKHKDKLPTTMESGIVYEYRCGDCNATYIGSTIKSLKTRASEHFGISSRSGNMLAKPPPSNILNHIYSCKCVRDFKQFSVLDRQNVEQALRISETVEIALRKPTLNDDQSAFPLFLQ